MKFSDLYVIYVYIRHKVKTNIFQKYFINIRDKLISKGFLELYLLIN